MVSFGAEARDALGTRDLHCQAVHVPDRAVDSHRETGGVGTLTYEINSMASIETLACPRGLGETHSTAQVPPCPPEVVAK